MTLREEIAQGENVALEFKEANELMLGNAP